MNQVIDGSQCLLDWCLCVPGMAVEQVDPVGLKPLQRVFDSSDDVIPRRADVVDSVTDLRSVFRRKHDLITPAGRTEEVADHPLGVAD